MEAAREEITVSIDIPAGMGDRFDRQYIKEAVAALSYYNGILSEWEACQLIGGITRREFEERVLPKFNLSLMGGTQEDIDFELEGL